MQLLVKIIGIAALGCLAACQSPAPKGDTGQEQADTTAAGQLVPAKPAGAIQVSFAQEKDTQQVKIRFSLNNQEKESSFDLPLAKDVPEADLYRTAWDKPNSCYIGVLKADRGTRYYHASLSESGNLQINQVGTPPRAVWTYVEDVLGLGKVHAPAKVTDSYKHNLQSGKIIADFIVRLEPASRADSIALYAEFGGASKKQSLPVPQGYKPVIQLTDQPDHCVFGIMQDQQFDAIIDIKVQNGRLQLTKLKQVFK